MPPKKPVKRRKVDNSKPPLEVANYGLYGTYEMKPAIAKPKSVYKKNSIRETRAKIKARGLQ